MKKLIRVLTVASIILSLCSCEGLPKAPDPLQENGRQDGASESAGLDGAYDVNGTQKKPEEKKDAASGGDLSLLYHMQRQYEISFTEDGYYYLTLESERIADGRHAKHLMYMDFDSGREIYLCSDASCTHNTADCTSVFPTDEFGWSSVVFVMDDSLYILSKKADNDGSATAGVLGAGSDAAVEAVPTVLYRTNPDGTGREKLYTFDPSVTVEDLVLGDAAGLYVITKKVSAEQSGGNTYQVSSQRKLCYLDLSSLKETVLFSMDFGDTINWDIIGCTGRKLVLYGIDFGREVSAEEKHSDDNSIYDTSFDVFATCDVDSGALNEIYRVKTPKSRSYETDENNLYFCADGKIISVDLQTGEKNTLYTGQDTLWGIVGDRIYTRDDSDRTLNFIDTSTGEITHCGLVDRSTGSSLVIVAVTESRVLAIYDSDVTPGSDGSYTVHGYRYGLISKDDLFHGRDNFVPIEMIGSGM